MGSPKRRTFTWIASSRVIEDVRADGSRRMKAVEIELCDWMFRAVAKDRRVLTTGYNGNPPEFEHCATMGCIREMLNVPSGAHHELCTGLHAEQNAIIQAATTGVAIAGATLYTTTFPCVTCAKMIMAARISEVVYDEGYPDELGRFMLARSSITVRRFGDPIPEDLTRTTTHHLTGVVAQMASVPNPRR